jgi:hypothetical protein
MEAASGKVAGMHGIPSEFWQRLEAINRDNKKDKGTGTPEKRTCDIVKVLTWVYNDIEEHGVVEGSKFSLGWMCPLFKKKDRTDIANYRPITILNSDYKIFTKALANKLSRVAPYLVHKNQSGFMKGRKITDAIYLAMEVVEYTEEDLQNGVIVALDQEKAYDKTLHPYLWDTLREQGIPELFVNTVRSLYKYADTHIIINGEISSSFRVVRGVRQGDPLSCLLFNLAIEPLASMLRGSNLKGYAIPGVAEKAVVQLFADDTTAYLSEYDNFEDLECILDKWCLASGARFNVAKTEIIPFGTPEYRTRLLETRKLNEADKPIPPGVHIAKEGEAVRILGSFIGNGVEAFGVWTPVLEKIDSDYERWANLHPTLSLRKNADQIISGSRSQYLAQVNGMPAAVTQHILKSQSEFINDSKSPMIARDTLMMPRELGGIGVLDLEARNEALLLVKAAALAEAEPEKRSLWASLALHRLSQHTVKSPVVAKEAKTNLMIQNIKVNQRNPPALHKTMVKCLNKYGISFETVQPSGEILRKLPLWHHPGENSQKRQENNGKMANCLRKNHDVLTVSDGMNLAQRLEDPLHYKRASCECDACEEDKETRGCENPQACVMAAAARLTQILSKWIPETSGVEAPVLEATPATQEGRTGQFVPPENITTLAQGLRVMTRRKGEPKERIDPLVRRRAAVEPAPTAVEIHIAGIVHAPSSRKARAAAGIFFKTDDSRNIGKRIPANADQTQYGAEIFAALEAARITNKETELTITSTQEYVQNAMNKKLPGWEHEGWVGVQHRDALRCLAAELKARKAPAIFKLAAPGSTERAIHRQASALAKRAARISEDKEWELTLPPQTALPGLSLQGNRQRVFYRTIREIKAGAHALTPRPSTAKMLGVVREEVETVFGRYVTDADIWKSLTSKDFLPRTAEFLWKGVHNSHRIGKYWTHIPECEDRATCQECGVIEDLEHILLGCTSPGRDIIWQAVESLWKEKEGHWPGMSLGTILGCGLAEFRDERGKHKHGTQRLYRILISESAYLIWKLRNDRVISRNGAPLEEQEIINKWKFNVNQRLQVDITLANRPLKGKRPALAPQLVTTTWSGTLDNERSLLANWLREPRVLVGSRAFPSRNNPQPQRRSGRGIG